MKQAKRDGRPFQEVLQYFGLERFLYRLSRTPHRDRFILKGGLMLRVWGTPESRPTRDIDLLGFVNNEITNLETIAREICTIDVEDDGEWGFVGDERRPDRNATGYLATRHISSC